MSFVLAKQVEDLVWRLNEWPLIKDDARIPDNEGNQPIDLPIRPDGAPAYFSSLPIKAMVQAIKKEGLPASVSKYGRYFCLQSFDVSASIW